MNGSATWPGEPYPLGWGVNGVHVGGGWLYFTNTDKGLFRVAVGEDERVKEEVKLVSGFRGADDFALGMKGEEVIVANHDGGGMVQRVKTATGEAVKVEVAGGKDAELLLLGITAVAFGWTERDRKTLYVVTNGGLMCLRGWNRLAGGSWLLIWANECDNTLKRRCCNARMWV